MHSMSVMTAANRETKMLLEKGVWQFYTGRQAPGMWGKDELNTPVQQFLTPASHPTSSCGAAMDLPPHFSILSTHYGPPVAYCLLTTPVCGPSPKHKVIFLPLCLRSSCAFSLELPALIPATPNPAPLLAPSSEASLGRGFLPAERSLTCWHSALVGLDGILP